jgi:hypothetical protein
VSSKWGIGHGILSGNTLSYLDNKNWLDRLVLKVPLNGTFVGGAYIVVVIGIVVGVPQDNIYYLQLLLFDVGNTSLLGSMSPIVTSKSFSLMF